MSKRSAEEKNYINTTDNNNTEIKKPKRKKYHRIMIYSSSDSETNFENETQENVMPSLHELKSGSPTPAPPLHAQTSHTQRSPSSLRQHHDENVLPALYIDQDPEIDSELLDALGDASEESPAYGPNIHSKLVQNWLPILKKGLPAETKEKLFKKMTIPDNCRLLKAPTVNPELTATLNEMVKNRDKKIQMEQDQLGVGIASINRAMTLLLTEGEKAQAIKMLSDGCRILTDLHYVKTQLRRKLITRKLEETFANVRFVTQDQDRDDTLFGKDLSEKIKDFKSIKKKGPSENRYQEYWSGPRQAYYHHTPQPTPLIAPSRNMRSAYSTKSNRLSPRRH